MNLYERTSASALGGATIHGDLAQMQSAIEAPLAAQKSALQKLCDEATQRYALITGANSDAAKAARRAHISALERQSDGVLATGALLLAEKKVTLSRAVRFKEAYRMLHGLVREAAEPSAAISAMVLGIMVFGEALINAAFFQNAYMVATPTAALLTSTLISATNILASALAGFFIGRKLNYGRSAIERDAPEFRRVRLRARLLLAGCIAAIGFLHLTVGLVRSQETLSAVHHSLAAYGELLNTPEAVLLVITGLCLSALAFFKGMTAFSDPYPHYGAYQRAINEAQEELLDLQEDLTDQIGEIFDQAEEADANAHKERRAKVKAHNALVQRCHSAHRDLAKNIALAKRRLAAQTAQLLDTYRASGGKADLEMAQADQAFEGYLNASLPESYPMPGTGGKDAALLAARARALERLGALFSLSEPDPHAQGEPDET